MDEETRRYWERREARARYAMMTGIMELHAAVVGSDERRISDLLAAINQAQTLRLVCFNEMQADEHVPQLGAIFGKR